MLGSGVSVEVLVASSALVLKIVPLGAGRNVFDPIPDLTVAHGDASLDNVVVGKQCRRWRQHFLIGFPAAAIC